MTAQEQKFRHMTEPPVHKLICKLAIPCIISMLVTSFYNMADTYFVGMMDSTAATGAIAVAGENCDGAKVEDHQQRNQQ